MTVASPANLLLLLRDCNRPLPSAAQALPEESFLPMCGLTGLYTAVALGGDALQSVTRAMTRAIAHRGPDDDGVWTDPAAGVALGFRRLAIIDVSPNGHQPMTSASGRYVMAYNGEVYNFQELRRELQDVPYRGHSDTEVMLAAFERWGVRAALQRFVGMFAIALWDRERRRLFLARDRLGKKPLYVFARPGFVAFASELKALAPLPQFDRTLDRDALLAYLRYRYVPAPRTIYRFTRKLEPGCLLEIADPGAPLPASEPYWSLLDAARAGLAQPWDAADPEIVAEGERLLADACRLRMISDVPLGAFLSGGIDSSTVVALMQAGASRPVRTFSVRFAETEYNEADHAARVARHLGTDHTEVTLTADAARDLVPQLPEMFDEPLADAGQLPSFLICQAARREVTVAVAGDGGDELFAGYHRYLEGERLAQAALQIPAAGRRLLAAGVGALRSDQWDRLYRTLAPVLPRGWRHRLPGEKIGKLGSLLRADSAREMYRSLLSAWPEPGALVRGATEPADAFDRAFAANGVADGALLDRMMLADQVHYLPDDLLAKTDRVSMAVSLEVRVPLLDHRVVEWSWRLPRRCKVRDGRGKWLLREVLHRHVPEALVDRPKMGFSVPLDTWLRGPLRDWAEALLAPERLAREGIFEPATVRRAWDGFKSGEGRSAHGLWNILVYQAWAERWRPLA